MEKWWRIFPVCQGEVLVYRPTKPQHDGQTLLRLTPMEFFDRIAVLMPLPRQYRHRYHGVLAPNAIIGFETESIYFCLRARQNRQRSSSRCPCVDAEHR
ncbi:MAG: hypothetical protein GY794_09335 [bacterium]|nr:hypothetical protein [bacterium]